MTNPNQTATETDSFVSWSEFLTSPYVPALVLVCLAVWLHAADSLIVATMLPSIVDEVGGAALVGWAVALYEIGSIVAGAASALLTLRYGLRLPMSLAAALFGVGCLLSAISSTMPLVLSGRALQGLGGGGLIGMGFVAVGVLFPARYMARALAAVSALWGVSAFLGPLIGGLFVEYSTWRWGFTFFGAQAFGLALWIARRSDETTGAPSGEVPTLPIRRLALLCLAVVLIAAAGIRIDPLRTGGLVLGGLLCLVLFLRLDGRAGQARLLPGRPFDARHSTGAALLMVLSLSIATIAITAFGPLLVTTIHSASALIAGYVVACSSIGWTVAAVLVSGSPERFDRHLIAAGMSLVALSILGFLYAVPAGPLWLIAVFAGVEGAGFGLSWTFILRRTTALAQPDEVQRISGAIPTVQRLGYALGAAYVGIVANASGLLTITGPGDAGTVARWIFAACLPFAALGLVAMIGLVRRHGAERA